MEEEKVITGYKGFDKDMKCRGFQYEAGKEYETDEAVLCEKGFHFCKNPHDVFGYYPAGEGNRFALVEAKEVSDERENDSKRVCKKLKINAEISVFDICKMAVRIFFENFGFKKKIESRAKGAEYALSHQWISVEEALPEYDEAVIVRNFYGEIFFCHRSNRIGVKTDDDKWCNYTGAKIVLWMPTPEFETKNSEYGI